jgi:hypothetical protein
MTQEALKLALEWAETHGEIVFAGGGMDAVNKMNSWVTAIKEAIREHAMYEVQRLGQDIEQEPVAHCEAGPEFCQQCYKESLPTYGSEEVSKLREVIQSQAKIIADYEKQIDEPAIYPEEAYEMGLEAIAYYTHPQQRTEQEPVAWGDLQKEAQQIVESKFLWKKFIDGTPLANDIACWMANFALQHTNPPQRTWVGLTNEELTDLFYNTNLGQQSAVSQAVALLKERNS